MPRNQMAQKPLLAISMGDPAGIGPEVILKALRNRSLWNQCRPVLVGSLAVFEREIKQLKIPVRIRSTQKLELAGKDFSCLDLLECCPNFPIDKFNPGEISAECGKAAIESLRFGAKLAIEKKVQAFVTAPVHKQALHRAGLHVEGQTEFFAQLAKLRRYEMLIQVGKLRVLLLTRHLSLKEALAQVKTARILDRIKLGAEFLREQGLAKPQIAVAGLNPHAGEGGIFGQEEKQEILPAIAKAKRLGIAAHGPFSADTIYRRAYQGEFDLVLALYHDQAFIPVKMIGFEKAVTSIVGLPFLRVSVIHGAGFDIAGKGIADEANMVEAMRVASEWSNSRSARSSYR